MSNKQLLQSAGDGTAVPAGYVGEAKHNQTSGCGTNATYQTSASITITPGVWMASSTAFLSTSNKVTDLLTFVTPSSGTSTNWRRGGYNDAWFSNDTGTVGPFRLFITSPNIMIRFDGTNMWRLEDNAWVDQTASSGTLYAKKYFDIGAGTCSIFQSSITAIRIN